LPRQSALKIGSGSLFTRVFNVKIQIFLSNPSEIKEPMTRIQNLSSDDRPLYFTALILLALEAIYTLSWVALDVGTRMSVQFGWEVPADRVTLIMSIPAWQEAVFFTGASMVALAVWMLLQMRRIAFVVFLIGVLLLRLDWILLAINPAESTGWMGYFIIIAEGLAGLMVGMLWWRNVLR
jgi:hypothetical protein